MKWAHFLKAGLLLTLPFEVHASALQVRLETIVKGAPAYAVLFLSEDNDEGTAALEKFEVLAKTPDFKDVAFVAVTPIQPEKDFPSVHFIVDNTALWVEAFGASHSSQTFVVDGKFELAFMGPMVDPIGGLKDSLVSVIRNQEVKRPAGLVTGEALLEARPAIRLTYNQDIAPIFRRRCESCHRPGGIQEQLDFTKFEGVAPYAEMIADQAGQRRMPPWPANHQDTVPMANDFSLSQEELFKVVKWAQQGAKEGGGQPPEAGKYPPTGAWTMGQPDDVYYMERSFDVPAEGLVDYVYLPNTVEEVDPQATEDTKRFATAVVPEDRYVLWSEIIPENPGVVHHVIVYVRSPTGDVNEDRGFLKNAVESKGKKGFIKDLQAKVIKKKFGIAQENLQWFNDLYGLDSNRNSWELGRSVPGENRTFFPKDFGVHVPKGSQFVFEMHYTPNGKAARDRSKIGVKWAKAAPRYLVHTVPMGQHSLIDIPAHAKEVRVSKDYTFTKLSIILSLRPHAHLRGDSFHYDLIRKDGNVQSLLTVPRWDFNNQPFYELKNPIPVEPGDKLRFSGLYNNTESNPNLTKELTTKHVRFGLQSVDEMFFGYVTVAERRQENEP